MSSPRAVAPTLWHVATSAASCYLWRPAPGRVVVVDPGLPGDHEAVLDAVAVAGETPASVRAIVLTHWHSDHSGATPALVEVTGATVYAGAADAALLRTGAAGAAPDLTEAEAPVHAAIAELDPLGGHAPQLSAVVDLHDGEPHDDLDGAVVLHLAGHTPGSVGLHLDDVVLTGDLTRVEDGQLRLGHFHVDRTQAGRALQRLAAIGPHIVGPGHGEPVDAPRRWPDA